MALLASNNYPGTKQQPGESYLQHSTRLRQMLDELFAKTAALPEGEVVGALLRFPVADGFACYVVEKAVPLTLQFFPYLDAYTIPGAHLRGLELEDVTAMVQQTRAWQKLMSRPRANTES